MRFFYSGLQEPQIRKLERILQQPAHQQLFRFLNEQQDNPVTLRKIQQHFSEEEIPQKKIDEMVDIGIVAREDRRYRLSLPSLDCAVYQMLQEEVRHFFEQPKISQSLTEMQLNLALLRQRHDISANLILGLQPPTISVEGAVWIDFDDSFPMIYPELTYVHSNTVNVYTFEGVGDVKNWAAFFNWNAFLNSKPEVYAEIFEQVGDVDPHFFLDFLGKKCLQTAEKAGWKERRYNLFSDMLVKMGDAVCENECFTLQLPIYYQSQIETVKKEDDFVQLQKKQEELRSRFSENLDSSKMDALKIIFFQEYLSSHLAKNDEDAEKWLIVAD